MKVFSSQTVCVRILGGLGNQMFQYAAGMSLARQLGSKIRLDLSAFGGYELRAYALSAFGVNAREVNGERPMFESLHDRLNRRMGGRLGQVKYHRLKVVTEPHFHFWEDFYRLSGNCYLDGYWQSPLYFRHIDVALRQTFALDRFSDSRSKEIESAIRRETQPVAVHIRRGDYVANPEFRRVHGICERSYYDHARSILEKLVGPSRFFIFSDDEMAARQEFAHWTNATFVSGNTQEQDMMLIAACSHAIIANSSFSWWAAWLNSSDDKVIIAPRLWFAREKMRATSTVDLYPESWILL